MAAAVHLLVCMTCRTAGQAPDPDPDAPRPGRLLAEALTGALPEGVVLHPVECLSNCSRGCTIALRGDDRWTYVYGNLDPAAHLDTLLDGLTRYRDSADGVVPWRERPEHFRKNCIARIPPMPAPAPSQKVSHV
jgi:predicted metal-binding protein